MSAQKKFKDHYPADKKNTSGNESNKNTLQDKRLIEAYLHKISKLLESDPELQKKAAQIIEDLINQKK